MSTRKNEIISNSRWRPLSLSLPLPFAALICKRFLKKRHTNGSSQFAVAFSRLISEESKKLGAITYNFVNFQRNKKAEESISS